MGHFLLLFKHIFLALYTFHIDGVFTHILYNKIKLTISFHQSSISLIYTSLTYLWIPKMSVWYVY